MGRARSLSDSTMKLLLCFLCLILPFLSDGATHLVRREALPSPQRGGGRSISVRPQNRFIFGQAGNAGLAGAALGELLSTLLTRSSTHAGGRVIGGETQTTDFSLGIPLLTMVPWDLWQDLLDLLFLIMLWEILVESSACTPGGHLFKMNYGIKCS